MGLKIFKGLMRIWCWFLIGMGLLIAFSGTLSVPVYFSAEADLYGWHRLWTALISLMFASLGAGAAWCGFRLRDSLNGRRRPVKKPVTVKQPESVKEAEAAEQAESIKQPEPAKQAEPVKKAETAKQPEPVKKPDFSQMSDITVKRAEDTIVLRWRKAGTSSSAECRAAEDGYELYFVRNIHDRLRAAGKPWLKITPQQLASRKGFENYIGWALELDGSPASEAAEHIREFILDREKRTGGKAKPSKMPAGEKLADRIRHGY